MPTVVSRSTILPALLLSRPRLARRAAANGHCGSTGLTAAPSAALARYDMAERDPSTYLPAAERGVGPGVVLGEATQRSTSRRRRGEHAPALWRWPGLPGRRAGARQRAAAEVARSVAARAVNIVRLLPRGMAVSARCRAHRSRSISRTRLVALSHRAGRAAPGSLRRLAGLCRLCRGGLQPCPGRAATVMRFILITCWSARPAPPIRRASAGLLTLGHSITPGCATVRSGGSRCALRGSRRRVEAAIRGLRSSMPECAS